MPRLARGSNLSRSTRKARSSKNLRQHAVVSCSNIATRNNNFDSELASKFDRSLQSLAYVTCTNCKVKCLQETKENFLCTTCRRDQNMLTAVNNMDPGDVPPQLQDLSPAEQMLIAKVQPVMRLYQYRSSGQLFYNGHVINIAQDLSEITNLLPRSPRSINVVIVRRATAEGFLEFRVRRQKVLDALTFLKNNNDFYNDINIDMNTLNDLPFDGTIEDEVPTIQIDNEQNEMPEGGLVTESAVSNIVFQNQREAVQRILEWPTGNPNPINEFHTPGYIVMAFPHLFPWGKADFNDHTRQTKLSFKQWCNFLIHFRDSRFATDKRFRYFCLNTMQRHEALDSGSIMAKKSDLGELTIDQLRTEFERNPGILNKLLAYGAHIRGTNAYWFKRRNELQAMCETLGAPTIFLTLSSADLWWPCMQKYFNIDQTILENERQMSLLMQKSLNDNPLIADEYFGIRVQIFMDILNEKFKVTDFWYRTEYQHRGSPHVHCLIWIEGAPDIRLFDSATIDEINSYRKFYDQLVSAVNPNQNEPPAVIHPSRLYGSTVEFGNVEKQAQLLNRVQRHTQHSIYCQRKVCGGLKCRFGYPKKIEEDSHLERNEKDEWVHTPKRNDELINDHNPFITHVWRANTDCKVVTSLQMVVNYLAKYAAKSEPASQSFRDTFSDILHSSEPTNNATTALQRTLMKLIGQRDISACEVMRLLTGEPLYHSSRQFITLYISNEDIVVLNEDGSHGSTALTKYLNRPRAAETLTLYQFTSSCNTNSRLERLTYYRKSRIVQVLPKVTLGVSEEYDELFYMQKVLIASVFRDIIEAKTHRTWHESFTHLDVGWWDFNGIANQEDEVEVVNPEIENVPWMEIAAVHPNVIPAHVHPGEREIDRDHDWFENISDYENINENVNFVKRVKEITQLESTRTHSSSVPLNNEQQQIIDQLTLQLNGLTNIKRTLITGPAGVGKSVVINKIVNITQSYFGDGSVLVLAPTGCAASNINGQTIHSALRLNIRNFSELQGENERNVQALFQNIRVVVCDEVSMCGQKLLAMIDKRLRQAKPENQDEVFGGLIVYLCGDMAQLLPVQDRALFMPADLSNQWYTHGRYVYEQIQKLFELKTIMRQSGEEQSDFRNALSHIANGTVTDEDYTFFASRFISKNIRTVSEFGNAIRIMARKEDVAAHNLNELAKLQNPVAFIRAINKPAIAATASSDECHFLENVIRLSKGCRVMLRHNLWTEAGLVNGAVGTVQDILYERVEGVSHLDLQPLCVLVEFDNYIGPTIYNNVVPISPVVTSFLKRGTKCTRKQFPLILAYSITIHKSQGMTLNQAVVDIGPREFSAGLTYVAVSRVRTVGGLLFDPGFPRDRLMKINSSSVWQHKRSDYMRLKTLS